MVYMHSSPLVALWALSLVAPPPVACENCGDVMCAMWCEHGFEQDDNGCPICRCNAAPPATTAAPPACADYAQCVACLRTSGNAWTGGECYDWCMIADIECWQGDATTTCTAMCDHQNKQRECDAHQDSCSSCLAAEWQGQSDICQWFPAGDGYDGWCGLAGCYMMGCGSSTCPTISDAAATEQPPVVGNDQDDHGCIASAGYTWCESSQKCIRSWEEDCTETVTEDPCAALDCAPYGCSDPWCMAPCGADAYFNPSSGCCGQCERCPAVRCSEPCEHGIQPDSNGCEGCTCAAAAPSTTDTAPPLTDAASTAEVHQANSQQCTPVVCRMFCEHGWQVNEQGCEICACASASTKAVVRSQVKFVSADISELPPGSAARHTFEQDFKSQMAAKIEGTSPADITILGITAGSVIVDFTVTVRGARSSNAVDTVRAAKDSGQPLTVSGYSADLGTMTAPAEVAEGSVTTSAPESSTTVAEVVSVGDVGVSGLGLSAGGELRPACSWQLVLCSVVSVVTYHSWSR